MKHIINLPVKQRLLLNEVENKVKNARSTNDYIKVNFGRKQQFIKVAFNKDNTYTFGFNFYNMEFQVKLNMFLKQYPKTFNGRISQFIFDWVNRLNR